MAKIVKSLHQRCILGFGKFQETFVERREAGVPNFSINWHSLIQSGIFSKGLKIIHLESFFNMI